MNNPLRFVDPTGHCGEDQEGGYEDYRRWLLADEISRTYGDYVTYEELIRYDYDTLRLVLNEMEHPPITHGGPLHGYELKWGFRFDATAKFIVGVDINLEWKANFGSFDFETSGTWGVEIALAADVGWSVGPVLELADETAEADLLLTAGRSFKAAEADVTFGLTNEFPYVTSVTGYGGPSFPILEGPSLRPWYVDIGVPFDPVKIWSDIKSNIQSFVVDLGDCLSPDW